ncbi:molybdopterin-dependent oxidoreductase [Mucilaginibacter ginkgonis]|uniref:Molybdopterin-dependent oxidoreductase n=1 Tax=Mucilaginibacter ginkgonis TaxID=2682091 RepID=A0A6I4IP39_9SPHI|nr:molybdopterin-dependent oxidoreductase [Mucilaginibacter ginkgonis]QQL50741.1 molybdopterin-dependent oxidoreductase [Mucilaginibacter ginkgonis]
MKTRFLTAVALLCLTLCANAQTVAVSGDVTSPFKITASTFTAMKQITVDAKGHDGKDHKYSGVLLADIVNQAGALPNGKLSGKTLAKYILIKAADGYRAVIALPETNSEFNDKNIILADKEDGKLLPASNGPFQIIIPGEKKWGRWVRQVTGIEIKTAKD